MPARSQGYPWTSEKGRFIAAERQQESGGNYRAVNGSSGALGAYQVLPSNLPEWLPQSSLPDMSPEAYLADDAAQDAVAWTILGGYYDHYGPAGAAAEWYSGQPDPHATYGNPPVYQYVNDVLALMGDPSLNTGGGSGGPPPPKPLTDPELSRDAQGIAMIAQEWVNPIMAWDRMFRPGWKVQ